VMLLAMVATVAAQAPTTAPANRTAPEVVCTAQGVRRALHRTLARVTDVRERNCRLALASVPSTPWDEPSACRRTRSWVRQATGGWVCALHMGCNRSAPPSKRLRVRVR
jgi:hypothetical protein